MSDINEFGTYLKKLRADEKISIENMAADLGSSTVTIYNLAFNRRQIKCDFVNKVINTYKLSDASISEMYKALCLTHTYNEYDWKPVKHIPKDVLVLLSNGKIGAHDTFVGMFDSSRNKIICYSHIIVDVSKLTLWCKLPTIGDAL